MEVNRGVFVVPGKVILHILECWVEHFPTTSSRVSGPVKLKYGPLVQITFDRSFNSQTYLSRHQRSTLPTLIHGPFETHLLE